MHTLGRGCSGCTPDSYRSGLFAGMIPTRSEPVRERRPGPAPRSVLPPPALPPRSLRPLVPPGPLRAALLRVLGPSGPPSVKGWPAPGPPAPGPSPPPTGVRSPGGPLVGGPSCREAWRPRAGPRPRTPSGSVATSGVRRVGRSDEPRNSRPPPRQMAILALALAAVCGAVWTAHAMGDEPAVGSAVMASGQCMSCGRPTFRDELHAYCVVCGGRSRPRADPADRRLLKVAIVVFASALALFAVACGSPDPGVSGSAGLLPGSGGPGSGWAWPGRPLSPRTACPPPGGSLPRRPLPRARTAALPPRAAPGASPDAGAPGGALLGQGGAVLARAVGGGGAVPVAAGPQAVVQGGSAAAGQVYNPSDAWECGVCGDGVCPSGGAPVGVLPRGLRRRRAWPGRPTRTGWPPGMPWRALARGPPQFSAPVPAPGTPGRGVVWGADPVTGAVLPRSVRPVGRVPLRR